MLCDRICWLTCWGSRRPVSKPRYCLLWRIWWGQSTSITDRPPIAENIKKNLNINLSLSLADVNSYVSDHIYTFYLLLYFIKKKERNGWSPFGWFYTNLPNVHNWCHSGILDVHVQNLHHVQPDVDEERIGRLVVGPKVHVVLQEGCCEHIGGFSDVAFLLSCRAWEPIV